MRIASVVTLLLVGCGGGGGQGDPAIDAPLAHDALPIDTPTNVDAMQITDAPDAVVTSNCPAPASFATVTAHTPQAVNESGPPADIKYSDPLDTAAEPDIFKLVLIEGRGAFATGYAPKTITLGGVEAKYETCGACVEVFANVDASNNFAAFYLATSGTLTITSFTPRLTGTLSNADLIHLNDDDSVNTDGCTTHIDSLAFDVPVQ